MEDNEELNLPSEEAKESDNENSETEDNFKLVN